MANVKDPNERTKADICSSRSATSIDWQGIREYLFNGKDEWENHSGIVRILASDPVFDKSRRDFMTRSERYKRALHMTSRIFELKELHGWSTRDTREAINLLDEPVPMGVLDIAFEPVFTSLASPTLIAKYGQLVKHRGILGCYLQTELGHGTNVPALETTATYIPHTREFDIHSPTITSSKWWIGGLAKSSTHGVVQARLVLPSGEDLGPHLFFVQLRSLEDHSILPGITLGDIGNVLKLSIQNCSLTSVRELRSKAFGAFPATDNGFAMFDHVRIPKENMLSKFAQVTDEGKYIRPPHAKLSYGGMLYIRSAMISTAGWVVARAATVSIRYATVRRQGLKSPDGLERQIISYPSVYYRLLPILSRSYVLILLGRNLSKAFDKMSEKLAKGDASLLAEMHAISSGLKVLASTLSIQDVETARRSMGGHGYSVFAGLGTVYANHVPSATYEGDNFVLDQQVVRAALKSYKALVTSASPSVSSPSPSSNYLRLLLQPESLPPKLSDISWLEPSSHILLLEWRAAMMVQERAKHQLEHDASADQRVSKAVAEAYVAGQVGDIIKDLPFTGNNRNVLYDLYRLYLLTTLESALTDLFSYGIYPAPRDVSGDVTRSLRTTIADVCKDILPHAIGLTDAFGFTDWELDSALGVYDGNVYEALLKSAKREPLNQSEIPSGYEEYIKPLLRRGQRLAGETHSKL